MKNNDEKFREKLEIEKRKSVAQLLFKSGRLINQLAIDRVRKQLNLPELRPAHMSLLPHIDLQGIHLTPLAKRMRISKQATGRLVTDFEKMGVIERLLDPKDGRAKLILFSDRGKRFFFEGLAILNEIEAELSLQIGKDRMQSLQENLIVLLEHLEN